MNENPTTKATMRIMQGAELETLINNVNEQIDCIVQRQYEVASWQGELISLSVVRERVVAALSAGLVRVDDDGEPLTMGRDVSRYGWAGPYTADEFNAAYDKGRDALIREVVERAPETFSLARAHMMDTDDLAAIVADWDHDQTRVIQHDDEDIVENVVADEMRAAQCMTTEQMDAMIASCPRCSDGFMCETHDTAVDSLGMHYFPWAWCDDCNLFRHIDDGRSGSSLGFAGGNVHFLAFVGCDHMDVDESDDVRAAR